MNYDILIMAAGLGKRMNSSVPKPVVNLLDKPMIIYILETISNINTLPDKIYIITYHKFYDVIISICKDKLPASICDRIVWLQQEIEPLGTGSSVQEAITRIPTIIGDDNKPLIILSSDVPMISRDTIQSMLNTYSGDKNSTKAVILTDYMENSTGYGRIIKNENGVFQKIVEEKDASDVEKAIKIVNTGIYCISYCFLRHELFQIDNKNAANEYYLTDLFGILKKNNETILLAQIKKVNTYELFNINTAQQLKDLECLVLTTHHINTLRVGCL
jgi:bifunctional UDP-N-acetylglucosamine pyrophosphorylase/glucosamine-1-phosphate N-acetyltransferase